MSIRLAEVFGMRDPTKLAYGEVFSVKNLVSIWDTVVNHWLIKGAIAVALSVNDWLFHPRHELVVAVYILICLDTLTGFLKAYRKHEVSSSGFFRFALKVIVYMVMLMTGATLDKISVIVELISSLSVVATFLAVTEAISILENSAALGFAVPTKLVKVLKFTQDQKTPPEETKKENAS